MMLHLKHLTFKMAFHLALGSRKCKSKIHAWFHKNIKHQMDWSKVSPTFCSKNHLAWEGPGIVSSVVIPALAPIFDKTLKEDRSLGPVRVL